MKSSSYKLNELEEKGLTQYYFAENICERRVLDSERLRKYLEENAIVKSYEITNSKYIVYFACGMLEEDSYKTIERFSNLISSDSEILVFGCYPSMTSTKVLGKNIHYIPLRTPEMFNQIIQATKSYSSIQRAFVSSETFEFSKVITEWDPRSNMPNCKDVFSLIASEGCSEKCSFCTIRYATGVLRSNSIDNIVNNLKDGLRQGFKVFRFQCENLGVYGSDIGESIGTLLDSIRKIKDDFSIDLPDLHPRGFVKDFGKIVRFMEEKRVTLLHLPVQSANQRILDLMNREYKIADVDKKIEELKIRFPDLRVGVDIITGFPTETEEEFMDSFRFLEKHKFNWIYLHGYNIKSNALANKIEPKIGREIIRNRIKYAFDRIPNIACYLNKYLK